ncbi:hypothetical protein GPECTOR_6g840 [Gonium pectorale]|uniref:Uncharacterized protein n=1 Tax=Gonium pectorale TaxID=33097 RepID=A0A150GW28_GONPE|nr:hypothetical protein GPECTOR_6g840 [Gonium pectorale]|eukprot:KXZ53922.1 hypothetical protein GPECTOR_6g840 [Gonium pectorale]
MYEQLTGLYSPLLYVLGAVACVAAGAELPSSGIAWLLHRGLASPCVYQLSVPRTLLAAPLLAAGEVLLMRMLWPGWGLVRLAAASVLLRVGGLGVAVAWEWWARRRFAAQMQQRCGKRAG